MRVVQPLRHTFRWAIAIPAASAAVAAPWASAVHDFAPGVGGNPSYPDPVTALGAPERTTGESLGFDSAVTIFNPSFGSEEMVSIGTGGWLDVRFDTPIVNDPGNLYGIDLIIFGNGGFVDFDPADGVVDSPDAAFGSNFGFDLMDVYVSADGVSWISVGTHTDGLFPAQGWRDVPPFGQIAGSVPTDFTRPVNPALTLADFENQPYAAALALYDGSGGGTPIDIALSGLNSVQYVRVANPRVDVSVEIEAFAVVPEPATLGMLCIGLLAVSLRRES